MSDQKESFIFQAGDRVRCILTGKEAKEVDA